MKKLVSFSLFFVLVAGLTFASDALVIAAQRQNEAALRQELRRGANVNYLFNERTALMEASNGQWLDGVRILLEEGRANPSQTNASQQTALMFAAKTNDNTDIIRMLVDRNANANARDNQRKTVLMYAAENQNDQIVNYLIRAGASTGATDIYNQDALIIAAKENNRYAVTQLLQTPGINFSQADTDGYTAFMYACDKEAIDMVTLFVQRGFDVSRQNNINGLPPLLWLIQFKKSYTIIEYLVRNTDAMASRDRNGNDVFWYLDRWDRDNTRLRRLLEDNDR
jgi:ankyrin repeat protein